MNNWRGGGATGGEGERLPALQIAHKLSQGRNLRYLQADITEPYSDDTRYDIIIDGHCLTDEQDRRTCLHNVHHLLNPGGVFLCLSMCAPINAAALERTIGTRYFQNDILYAPLPEAANYHDAIQLDNVRWAVPTRKVPHWTHLAEEFQSADFRILSTVYEAPAATEPFGTFAAACKLS